MFGWIKGVLSSKRFERVIDARRLDARNKTGGDLNNRRGFTTQQTAACHHNLSGRVRLLRSTLSVNPQCIFNTQSGSLPSSACKRNPARRIRFEESTPFFASVIVMVKAAEIEQRNPFLWAAITFGCCYGTAVLLPSLFLINVVLGGIFSFALMTGANIMKDRKHR